MKVYKKNVGIIKPIDIIVAVDETGGFGKEGKIPWHFPEDLKHFQTTTKNSTCIMGRKTYQDIYNMTIERKKLGTNKKKLIKIEEILPGRENFVISNSLSKVQGAKIFSNLRNAIMSSTKKKIFVIGGERLFTEALNWTKMIHMTLVKGNYYCDKFFPVDYVKKHFKINKGKKLSDNLLYMTYTRKI